MTSSRRRIFFPKSISVVDRITEVLLQPLPLYLDATAREEYTIRNDRQTKFFSFSVLAKRFSVSLSSISLGRPHPLAVLWLCSILSERSLTFDVTSMLNVFRSFRLLCSPLVSLEEADWSVEFWFFYWVSLEARCNGSDWVRLLCMRCGYGCVRENLA